MQLTTRFFAIAGIGLLLAAAFTFGPRDFGTPTVARALANCSPSGATLDAEESNFLSLLNSYRVENGLVPLAASANLTRSAAWLAADMGANAYFDHADSAGRGATQRVQDCGYPDQAGENIAAGLAWSTGQDVFTAWRNSPGHNANLLNASYRMVGIGRAYVANSPYGWYWVADFGFAEDGTAATPEQLPFTGVESGIRSTSLTPGAWNVATVLPGGMKVSDLQGWSAWVQLANGWWQEYGADEFIPGGTVLGLLPRGLSLDRGRTAR
ncbi:MAG: CAP domain-containing protein [Chloroflexi bacterium]|nr:CAP domain-containing protein [Chloroflexota bacterium]